MTRSGAKVKLRRKLLAIYDMAAEARAELSKTVPNEDALTDLINDLIHESQRADDDLTAYITAK